MRFSTSAKVQIKVEPSKSRGCTEGARCFWALTDFIFTNIGRCLIDVLTFFKFFYVCGRRPLGAPSVARTIFSVASGDTAAPTGRFQIVATCMHVERCPLVGAPRPIWKARGAVVATTRSRSKAKAVRRAQRGANWFLPAPRGAEKIGTAAGRCDFFSAGSRPEKGPAARRARRNGRAAGANVPRQRRGKATGWPRASRKKRSGQRPLPLCRSRGAVRGPREARSRAEKGRGPPEAWRARGGGPRADARNAAPRARSARQRRAEDARFFRSRVIRLGGRGAPSLCAQLASIVARAEK